MAGSCLRFLHAVVEKKYRDYDFCNMKRALSIEISPKVDKNNKNRKNHIFPYFFDHFDQTLNAERLFKKNKKRKNMYLQLQTVPN